MLPTLNGRQLAIIATAADRLPPEKRDTFLDRVKARLQLHSGVPTTRPSRKQCARRFKD